MSDTFHYDVFLSHSAKDKAIVRPLAERLRADGLRVWLDEWIIKAGDSIPAKIEAGLEHSRVLVLCLSANAMGSDWAQLESGTFRFRDPLNTERRFIPLRLDATPAKGSLGQFAFLKWYPAEQETEYPKLREACQPPAPLPTAGAKAAHEAGVDKIVQLDTKEEIYAFAFSPDGQHALTGGDDGTVRLWEVATGRCKLGLDGHTNQVWSVAWSPDGRQALSGCSDKTVRLWEVATGRCEQVLAGQTGTVWSVAWSPDGRRVLSGSNDDTVRLWDVATGRCERVLEGHTDSVLSVAWSPDGRRALSGGGDNTVRLWAMATGPCERVLEGHTDKVSSVAWSLDGRWALSGSWDGTVRLWDVTKGRCERVLEGHTWSVLSVAWSPGGRRVVSGGGDNTVRLWDVAEPVAEARPGGTTPPAVPSAPEQVQYTNAKVLLVGESGAGKTGLAKRLALNDWQPSDSTVGAWATQWKLPVAGTDGVEREIWLWDFGGQADQRLIHQLYMDETALAVLVFDGQKDDVFETLGQWDRDLSRASRKEFTKLLVAGRVDAGGLRVSRGQVEAFQRERGYRGLLETSAKTNRGCEELKQAILTGIRWEDIPWRSSPRLFKLLKEEIIRLKDEGRVLLRFNELRETLQLRLVARHSNVENPDDADSTRHWNVELRDVRFTDEELQAVVSLLAGPGVVWELEFGSWVLLQPERINAYAQAVIQTMREDEHERGCLAEEKVLGGELTYHRPAERLARDEERFVLLAMHKLLVERGLCLREHTELGTMLIFPSYYRRERAELVGHPARLVSYRFNGFLDEIYATLVVRLHHTKPFNQKQLWRYAADFETLTGKQLGVKLERRAEGAGELVVYADPSIGDGEKIIFSRYVHEHILQKGRDLVRLRHYVCPHCGTPVGNREVAMERLDAWLANRPTAAGLAGKIKAVGSKPEEPTILCAKCEQRVPLWDVLEQHFASDEVKERVRQLQAESDLVLDNESKDRALVGEVISTVALAGQIIEEYSAKRYGLDMELEFKDDEGKPTALKLYLQLKSGDSHLRKRERDGAEVFQIHHEDHAKYWMAQAYPVLLVIANSAGEVRRMEIRDWLKRASDNGKKDVKQIVFQGERFDVMSVRRWREKALGVGKVN